MSSRRVLVVDDESSIADLLAEYLRRDGFEPIAARTGEQALEVVASGGVDAVILDVRLPGIDGFEVLRRIRTTSSVPVVMLTARAEETDTLIGLEVGADDYITKPFSPREVVARVKAVLRRTSTQGSVPEAVRVFATLRVDSDRHEVVVDGALVALTALEFDLLWALTSAPGRVFTRRQLIERVWGWDFFGDERVVDVHVRKLRSALGDDAGEPRFIATVRGVGYKCVAQS